MLLVALTVSVTGELGCADVAAEVPIETLVVEVETTGSAEGTTPVVCVPMENVLVGTGDELVSDVVTDGKLT